MIKSLAKKRKNLLISLVLFIFIIFYVHVFLPKRSIGHYYEIIKNQEVVSNDLVVFGIDIEQIRKCKNKNLDKDKISFEDCLRDFYRKYTINNGAENAFKHLAYIYQNYPEMLPGCHYISHGIGNGSLVLNKNDVGKSYAVLKDQNFFKNIVTCANGYFHGVMEEYAKNTTNKKDLVKLMKPVCQNYSTQNNCHHGVGHAATIQLGYNLDNALYVCDNLTSNKKALFDCYTGVFMEIGQYGIENLYKVENGEYKLLMCDSVSKKYRTACYLEQTSYAEWFTKEPRNYTRNIGFCKQIKNDLNRIACVKLNAIRAVRIARYEKINEMCSNTSSKEEQVMCTAIFATRIAGTIDKTASTKFHAEVVKDICKSLPFYLQIYCEKLAFKEYSRLFYTDVQDLVLPKIDLERMGIFFKAKYKFSE